MIPPKDDINGVNVYSPENLLLQASLATEHMGYKKVHFYVEADGTLAKSPTARLALFYLSASGGTLRDEELNLVLYSAKFDKFKGLGRK